MRPYTHHAKIDAYAYATQRPAEYRKTQTYERKSERAEQRETIAPIPNYIRMEKTSSVQTTIGKDKTRMVERNEIKGENEGKDANKGNAESQYKDKELISGTKVASTLATYQKPRDEVKAKDTTQKNKEKSSKASVVSNTNNGKKLQSNSQENCSIKKGTAIRTYGREGFKKISKN